MDHQPDVFTPRFIAAIREASVSGRREVRSPVLISLQPKLGQWLREYAHI